VSYFSAKVRPALRYKQLSHEVVRADLDEAIAGTGWEPVLARRPRRRLAKRNFELVFADD
jgi:hypothetical protein